MENGTRPTKYLLSPERTRWFLRPIAHLLKTGDPAATMDRLFESQHVKDLQLIMAGAFFAVLMVLIIGLLSSFFNEVVNNWHDIHTRTTDWVLVRYGLASVGDFLVFFAPVLAAFAGLLAWVYQVGGARLGVVDLFACEISTLCRVMGVVDVVHRTVDKYGKSPTAQHGGADTSNGHSQEPSPQEEYFPVFTNCIRDLETLEARVVIDITAFYTYMKAVRDTRRALSAVAASSGDVSGGAPAPRDLALRDLVYMIFLGLESARHAIKNLVEFEPEQAERTVVILLNELEAYAFLERNPNEGDSYQRRLALRRAEYERLVPHLIKTVRNGRATPYAPEQGSPWEGARQLVEKLQNRFDAI